VLFSGSYSGSVILHIVFALIFLRYFEIFDFSFGYFKSPPIFALPRPPPRARHHDFKFHSFSHILMHHSHPYPYVPFEECHAPAAVGGVATNGMKAARRGGAHFHAQTREFDMTKGADRAGRGRRVPGLPLDGLEWAG
jgi:hypothetical protein